MSRLFILFLIALLPLRGWTAQQMVFQMGQGAPVAAASADHAMHGTMPADCALHMQLASGDHASSHASSHGADHKGCESCQLCMPLVALASPVLLTLAPAPQALTVTHGGAFASADTARAARPPIS